MEKDQREVDIRMESGRFCTSKELGPTWIMVLTNPHFQLVSLQAQWQSGCLKAQFLGGDTQTVWNMQRDF